MATERQIAANRANARRSTGPRTAAGKAASSANAVKHGLSARPDSIVLSAEFDQITKMLRVETSASDEAIFAAASAQIHLEHVRLVKSRKLVSAMNQFSDKGASRKGASHKDAIPGATAALATIHCLDDLELHSAYERKALSKLKAAFRRLSE